MDKVIVEMTPFIFEDGNTYYFQIFNRPSTNDYQNLYVYEKKVTIKRSFWGKETIKEDFVQLNERAELVDYRLKASEIKHSIKKILTGTKAGYIIKDWDGFVGDIPDNIKKSLSRDNKLKDLGIE
jgi:hypothetical protein